MIGYLIIIRYVKTEQMFLFKIDHMSAEDLDNKIQKNAQKVKDKLSTIPLVPKKCKFLLKKDSDNKLLQDKNRLAKTIKQPIKIKSLNDNIEAEL